MLTAITAATAATPAPASFAGLARLLLLAARRVLRLRRGLARVAVYDARGLRLDFGTRLALAARRTTRPFRPVATLRALCTLGALRALRPFSTVGSFHALGALGAIRALTALGPRLPLRVTALRASSVRASTAIFTPSATSAQCIAIAPRLARRGAAFGPRTALIAAAVAPAFAGRTRAFPAFRTEAVHVAAAA